MSTNPIRILHIVGGMNTGGVETWLMHVLRHIDRTRFQLDFMVHTEEPCFYDEEIRSLGSRILPCMHPKRPLQYAANFRRILKEHGPYDGVHSHVHHFSGFTLLLARLFGVRQRIAHSHNDISVKESGAGPLRRFYLATTEWLIERSATVGLACSELAAASLFGLKWKNDPRWKVLYCGIDLEPFKAPVDRAEVRTELGLPLDAFVLGHVGGFREAKNHEFLLDIFAQVAKRESKAWLLLVGEGSLRKKIEQKAQRLGLEDKVIFAGVRADIPRLMKGAMDVFVFPSRWEGLGLVLVEAQAAGLRCAISDVIPAEVVIIPQLVCRLSLSGLENWAQQVTNGEWLSEQVSKSQLLVENSKFNIRVSLDGLCAAYP
ncbi:MAG: glycosyltransferase family 1 protein [Candidatus Omnitrophica bacterium]|nr:glycosyltransferase family 1 protein [Candidatus Omnitrophota bacterium]